METREQMLVSVGGVQVFVAAEEEIGRTPLPGFIGLELKGRWSLGAIVPFLWVVLIKTKSRVKELILQDLPSL